MLLKNFSPVYETFSVGLEERNDITVGYSPFGLEVYAVNGKVICRRRNLKSEGSFVVEVGEEERHHVEIKVKTVPWNCLVMVDGETYISELFPKLTRSGLHSYLMIAVISVLVIPLALVGFLINAYSYISVGEFVFTLIVSCGWLALLRYHWRRGNPITFGVSSVFVFSITQTPILAKFFHIPPWQLSFLFFLISFILLTCFGRRFIAPF